MNSDKYIPHASEILEYDAATCWVERYEGNKCIVEVDNIVLNEKGEYEEENVHFVKHACGVVELDGTPEELYLFGRPDKVDGVHYPYHTVWVDGAESIPGKVILPKTTYSKVIYYKSDGTHEEVLEYGTEVFKEGEEGDEILDYIITEKPYYKIENNQTVVYVNGFSGVGTQEDPWKIYNFTDLSNVGANDGDYTGWTLDSYYILMNDIDCGNTGFAPIGGTSNFNGDFNGNGKTISNFSYTGSYSGLFYNVIGKIYNFRLKDSYFRGINWGNTGAVARRIGLASIAENVIVESCHLNADSGPQSPFGAFFRGIIRNCATINCTFSGSNERYAIAHGEEQFSPVLHNCFTTTLNTTSLTNISASRVHNTFYDKDVTNITNYPQCAKSTSELKNINTFTIPWNSTNSGTVDISDNNKITLNTGDTFDLNNNIIYISNTKYDILSFDSNTVLYVDATLSDNTGLNYDQGNGSYGLDEAWDISTAEEFDIYNPTTWYILNGVLYPRLFWDQFLESKPRSMSKLSQTANNTAIASTTVESASELAQRLTGALNAELEQESETGFVQGATAVRPASIDAMRSGSAFTGTSTAFAAARMVLGSVGALSTRATGVMVARLRLNGVSGWFSRMTMVGVIRSTLAGSSGLTWNVVRAVASLTGRVFGPVLRAFAYGPGKDGKQ